MLNLILLALMPVGFALNSVVGRALTGQFAPAQLTTIRWLLAGALVGLFILWRGRKAEHWSPGRSGWLRIIILGAFGMGFCGYAAYAGAQASSATNVSLIYTTTSALVVFYEIMTRQQRAETLLIAGVALSISGAVMIITKGYPHQLAQLSFNVGDLWAVAGTISWAAYTIAMKRDKSDLTPLALFTVMSLAGAVATAPFAAMETLTVGPPVMTSTTLAWVTALVLVASVGSYLSYNLALVRCGPILTSAALTLTSVYTAVMAMALINEELAWYHAAGGALVISGLGLINLQRSRSSN